MAAAHYVSSARTGPFPPRNRDSRRRVRCQAIAARPALACRTRAARCGLMAGLAHFGARGPTHDAHPRALDCRVVATVIVEVACAVADGCRADGRPSARRGGYGRRRHETSTLVHPGPRRLAAGRGGGRRTPGWPR